MKRSIYKKKKNYGKGAKDLIRPTLNKGRIFVGEGLLKKRYKKVAPLLLNSIVHQSKYKKNKYYGKGAKNLIRPTLNNGKIYVGEGLLKKKPIKKKKRVYGKGIFAPLLLGTVVPKLLDKIL